MKQTVGYIIALIITTTPISASSVYLGPGDGGAADSAYSATGNTAVERLTPFGRTEDKVKIFVRKEYLDDDALNAYIGLARGGYDIASEAAFRYLDYEVTINVVFDIPFEDRDTREAAIEELRWKRERAAVWADEVLAKAPPEEDAYVILVLKAEMQHEQEMEEAVEEFERFAEAAASAYEYGGPIPEKPLIRCEGSRTTLETLAANCRDDKLLAYALYFLGFIAEEEGRVDDAEAYYLNAATMAEDRSYYPDICFRLGEMALYDGDYRKAISYYERVSTGSDYYSSALYGIAYAKYALAGIENDPRYDGEVLNIYEKLDEECRYTAITEHCSRTAAASLVALAASESAKPVNAHGALEVFEERLAGRLSDRSAATLLRAVAQDFDKSKGDYAEAIVVYVALLDRYPEYEDNPSVIREISRVFSADPDREAWYRQLFLARYGRDTAFYDGAGDEIRLAIDRYLGD
ncbi:MAG: tetratricopeptide repeat protein [Candidatus Coatesbacteria bacterium]|nr:MAG: tetratricopeptide repeat protein [Candidatus Coatesbacteria bacterium]